MKISAFRLMPHRELPADFEQRYGVGLGHAPVVGAGRRPPRRPVLPLGGERRTDDTRQRGQQEAAAVHQSMT
jgi:hypothetical protein